jgi:phage baseplate assembly protein gpV
MPLEYSQHFEDSQEAIRSAIEGNQAEMWTGLPGIVQSYDDKAITVTVQPAIKILYTGPDLVQKFTQMPVLLDVPVYFPRGGGVTMTYPIAAGDECFVVFSSRCIDEWWDQGGIQETHSLRKHDLSDGFAFVGPFSQKTKIDKVSTTTVQLRSNVLNGSAPKIFIEIDVPNDKAQVVVDQLSFVFDGNANTITAKAPTKITLDTPLIECTGDVHVDGEVVAKATGSSVTLSQHRHGTGNPAAGTVPPTGGT